MRIQSWLFVALRGLNVMLVLGLVFLVCGRLDAPRPAPILPTSYPPPDPLPAVAMPTLSAPPESELEEQKEPKAADEPWWIVLKMSEKDYVSRHSEAVRYMRAADWHYGDCLMQRAHYRLRLSSPAKLRRLRQLEKALDDWGQAYCERTCISPSAGGFVFSVAHLKCGMAIDRIVQSYRYPQACPSGASELLKATQKLVKECARLNRTPDEDGQERGKIPQKVTQRLLRETKPLTGEAAQAVAKYMDATVGNVDI